MPTTAIDSVVGRCDRAIGSAQACPLCVGEYLPQMLKSHLARHMQQLALFALPRTDEEDVDRESGGAPESIVDEDVDQDFVDSVGLDQVSAPPSLEYSVLGLEERSMPMGDGPSQTLDRTEECDAVLAALKNFLGSEHPDTLTRVNNLVLAIMSVPGQAGYNIQRIPGADKDWLEEIFRANGVKPEWTAEYENALDKAIRDGHQCKAIDLLLTSVSDTNYATTLPSELVAKIAKIYSERRLYDTAILWYRGLLATQESTLGVEHPLTFNTLCDMAGVFSSQFMLDDAVELYRRVLAGQERLLGMDNPATLDTVSKIALVISHQGLNYDALDCYRRALAGQEKHLGIDHPATLDTVIMMGREYSHLRDIQNNSEWYRPALTDEEKRSGIDDPVTLDIFIRMGNVFCCQASYDDALKWYRRALAGQQKHLGVDHPDTLDTIVKIGDVFSRQGSYDVALEWYRRALAGQHRELGKEHPTTLDTVRKIGEVTSRQVRYDNTL